VWLAATGQIFFSLSVGFGVIINYASYLKRRADVNLSGLTAASTNEFFEVCLGGMITIPAAFVFLGAAGAVGGTFGLGFVTLPVVFAHMPGGNLFGALWFLMLFLAAITSSLSMLQPVIAFLEEGLGLKRKASASILCGMALVGSAVVLFYSKGLMTLDAVDFWIGTFLLFVLATLQILLFSWVWGADEAIDFANENSHLTIPRVFRFLLKFVSPTYLLVIFLMWCTKELPERVTQLIEGVGAIRIALGLIGGVSLVLMVLVWVASRRWRRLGLTVSEALPGRASPLAWACLVTSLFVAPVGFVLSLWAYNTSARSAAAWRDRSLKGVSIVLGSSVTLFGVIYFLSAGSTLRIQSLADGAVMTAEGWAFMLVSVAAVFALVFFSYYRVLRSPADVVGADE